MKKQKKTQGQTRSSLYALTEGGLMLALALVLGWLRLFELPQGGSVTLAMLPLVLYGVRHGTGRGLLLGTAFGFLKYFVGAGLSVSWVSLIGDYVLAFAAVGVGAGLFGRFGMVPASLAASAARFAVHWVVGAVVWGEYMPETFWNLPMTNTWVYSAIYNGSYMALNCLALVVVSLLLCRTMPKYTTRQEKS